MITIAMACHALTLAGIGGLIEASGIYKIDIRSSSGHDLINQLQHSPSLPDLCIIGAKPEGIDGYHTMQQIAARWPQLKTIVLTSLQSPVSLMLMMHYGAQGYTSLSSGKEMLMENLALINEGYSCYPHDLTLQLNAMLKMRKRRHGISIFSQKELEIIYLLCKQYATKQIASELKVSECTVNVHLKSLFEKLEVTNKHELMACLYDAGFDIAKKAIPPPPRQFNVVELRRFIITRYQW